MTRRIRCLAPALLTLAPGLTASPALAQNPPGQTTERGDANGESGRPLDGYLATGVLAGIALFVVGKSARRP
ncbi:MAG TPA: hypothetical protein VKP69_20675 [Isosphaeraceae bacterium]|jgi:hypothetical protein|nr:hypothetical protein [Isosphaeraceae bacterium]